MKNGQIFVIAAPSGAGKTTVSNQAIAKLTPKIDISKVVTYTTRHPRPTEINGQDYNFIDFQDFKQKEKNNFFLETTEYSGALYGSPKNILDQISLGKSFIIVTDLVGVKEYKKLIPNSIFIWLTIPNLDILRERLIKRGDHKDKIDKRLDLAKQEVKEAEHNKFFNYFIVNNIFDKTVQSLCEIIEHELTSQK
ncbi:MAG: Guanylate kinase [candidate division TM6 bacterium GW2011_GWF2_28_16]|nr:MAG: Guanylate kinase [candidate division TM6 bacterium GW2011_GWF2_28_16]